MTQEPVSLQCWHCDFGTGQRGMDTCRKCRGTGRLFWANGYSFPYTPEGEAAAKKVIKYGGAT